MSTEYEAWERAEQDEEAERLAAMHEARREYDAATPAERAEVIRVKGCYAVQPPIEEDECPHDEHDHGICLDCGKDITDDLVAAAEFAADCREDR